MTSKSTSTALCCALLLSVGCGRSAQERPEAPRHVEPGAAGASALPSPEPAAASAPPASSVARALEAHVVTGRSHDDIGRWILTSPSERATLTPGVGTVRRGEKIYAVAVLTNYEAGPAGIDIAADYRLLRADGSVVATFSGRADAAAHASADPRARDVLLVNPVIDLTFDDSDRSGEYRIELSIRDGDRTASASTSFVLE